ncbi:MAG: Na+/H+ antiporter subunit E [Candidatus Omnitrophica bacterium]|nr:Na+/H+ antiporter subunit E [Candidatus Omnitrophota bacterium]MBU1090886.1 Na+/H+ antiporter subunit E [Candidatus Omnitrophota bacterium]MBU1905751.1 Na+/H+ antiporter subunit E [Candidatus Omnitrophota bacterium]
MKKRKSSFILFLLALIIWMILSWPPDLEHLIVGIFIAAFVAFMTGDMFVKRPYVFKHLSRYVWFAYYIPVFIWECIKANIDVAYRVSHPNLPINPGIVKVKTSLKSDTGLTFLANSITLTPGTMSVDIDQEKGYLYIHWIDVKETDIQKATEHIVYRFEDILKRIFE